MKVVFVGGGHMAAALVGGLAAAGGYEICVVERNEEKRHSLVARYKVATVASLGDVGGADLLAADAADIIVLAVRPNQIQDVCKTMADSLAACSTPPLVVSVAAALRTADLSRWLGGWQQVVRAMPNTPAALGLGMTLLYADSAAVNESQRAAAAALFEQVGRVAWLSEERLIDAGTAISGSGPGYFYYFIEGMQNTAAAMGLDDALANELILQTMRGAVAMVEQGADCSPPLSAADLRHAVAVKGGTTERAIGVMEARTLHDIFAQALLACRDRASELGEQLSDADSVR